jgi:NitT/TauT family transport system permease protein
MPEATVAERPAEPPTGASSATELSEELAGLDALELADRKPKLELAARAWRGLWPKLGAVTIFLFIWQVVVWLQIWPDYVLPGPVPVFQQLWSDIASGTMPKAIGITLQRAFIGYSIAIVLGVVIGALVSRIGILRTAVGSMITGLQTMPSIAWFPLALLLFKQSEAAIYFVVVLGATPAIANGLISGTDHIPPILLRAGRVLGARRLTLYRHVVLPASLPSFVGGLKQGWAFAWRSLMAGELIVIIASRPSLGVMMQNAKDFADAPGLLSVMVVIFIIGVVVDSLFFGTMERALRRRWGLIDTATA